MTPIGLGPQAPLTHPHEPILLPLKRHLGQALHLLLGRLGLFFQKCVSLVGFIVFVERSSRRFNKPVIEVSLFSWALFILLILLVSKLFLLTTLFLNLVGPGILLFNHLGNIRPSWIHVTSILLVRLFVFVLLFLYGLHFLHLPFAVVWDIAGRCADSQNDVCKEVYGSKYEQKQ